jgi:hypothetical protein
MNKDILLFFLCLTLATITLPVFYNSISVALFSVATIYFIVKKYIKANKNKYLFLLILFYVSIFISYFRTINLEQSFNGLIKSISFLLFPFLFLFLSTITTKRKKIFEYFSITMAFYAVVFFLLALSVFFRESDKEVFYFHNLVGNDRNAIYMGVFSSFCFFYFFNKINKKAIDVIAQYILLFFIFLLNSKTVFFIDFVLIIIHYIFYNETKASIKFATSFVVLLFTTFSIFFIPQVSNRILDEYQTAFVDNIVVKQGVSGTKQYNISLHEAWTKKHFKQNDFFPGTAIRVFNVRVFKELYNEKKIGLLGVGINASDDLIKEKYRKYNLFKDQNYYNFHNQYIQTFVETGLLGFVLLVLILCCNFVNAIKRKDFLHFVFAFSMIVILFTESMFCRQRGIVFFVTLYCIFNSVSQHKKS